MAQIRPAPLSRTGDDWGPMSCLIDAPDLNNELAMKFRRLAAGFTAIAVGATAMAPGNAVPLLQPGASFKAAVSSGAEPAAARRSVAVRGPHGGMAARTNVVRPGARPVHPIARPGVRPGAKPVHPIARPGRPSVRPPYLHMASRRCDRRRSGVGLRGRKRRGRLCRRAPGARLLLVLHRFQPDAGFLGRLPVRARTSVTATVALAALLPELDHLDSWHECLMLDGNVR